MCDQLPRGSGAIRATYTLALQQAHDGHWWWSRCASRNSAQSTAPSACLGGNGIGCAGHANTGNIKGCGKGDVTGAGIRTVGARRVIAQRRATPVGPGLACALFVRKAGAPSGSCGSGCMGLCSPPGFTKLRQRLFVVAVPAPPLNGASASSARPDRGACGLPGAGEGCRLLGNHARAGCRRALCAVHSFDMGGAASTMVDPFTASMQLQHCGIEAQVGRAVSTGSICLAIPPRTGARRIWGALCRAALRRSVRAATLM